ncbi:uncharacterized protein LOC131644494 isoform X3 [Vicia villosa]|uniref:uncharacterized protein LOC131644494 isoform X2 n=1 Tax=Vicia villosa TaxID=3911 RepID=UPI00273CF1DC|nr:uncharacterized protein LOC131644494 isoform X2 [Vicia villosa]XP_058770991.1 uncharacterized protein LOC131644494 isoform X3 [Vicia villosa]
MDKKWMNANRLSKEYENGVLEFVKFAVEHVKDAGRMKCPCLGCCYGGRVDADGLKSHLLTHGIDRSYKCWIYHGEKINENVEPVEKSNTTTYAPDDNDTDTYDCDRVEEIAEALEEDLKDCPKRFERLVSDAEKPLYKGCSKFTRLSALTRESSSETFVPPHVSWKEARVGKDGVVKEDVQKVFEKCETLSQSISPDEDNDCRSILSRALDIPEYSGRVRGKGFGITPTSLKMKKQKAPSNRELQETLYALQAEVRELKREKELREQASGCKATSDKGSISCNFQPDLPEGISPCQLYLSSPTYRMVGKGKVHNTLGELLHTRPFPTGCLKVSVDTALEKDALLPHPDDFSDATLVGDAIGSFVAWPSSLISVDDETPTKSKAKDKEPPRKIESVASIKETEE